MVYSVLRTLLTTTYFPCQIHTDSIIRRNKWVNRDGKRRQSVIISDNLPMLSFIAENVSQIMISHSKISRVQLSSVVILSWLRLMNSVIGCRRDTAPQLRPANVSGGAIAFLCRALRWRPSFKQHTADSAIFPIDTIYVCFIFLSISSEAVYSHIFGSSSFNVINTAE